MMYICVCSVYSKKVPEIQKSSDKNELKKKTEFKRKSLYQSTVYRLCLLDY